MDSGGHGPFRKAAEAVTVGYHAPPPAARTGVADYAETLRRALEAEGVLTAAEAAGPQVYHVGNNGLHAQIYRDALRRPGVVVLHDAVLHHFMLGQLSRHEYVAEFVHNYGEWRRDLAQELWMERGGSAVDARYFEFPMLRRLCEVSRAVIAHNPAAANAAKAHGAAEVHVIPHFVTQRPQPGRAAAAEFRREHGIAQTAVLFGIFGYLRETKRILPAIRAFRRLHAVRPEAALLIAGDAVSDDLTRLLQAEAAHPGIYRAGFLSETDFDRAAAAIDCCVNLRYPGAGETSGVTIRMAAAGVPLIVTRSDESSLLPEASCLRVRPGVAEAEELFDHMSVVASFPHIARAIGQQARQHMAEQHAIGNVARQYREVLCGLAS